MSPINLYLFSCLPNCLELDDFECHLSKREKVINFKNHEFLCAKSLVQNLCNSCTVENFDFFYYSYLIPQIGKEFDLLRISNSEVLNIELKTDASNEEILNQLCKNKYYLQHLSKAMHLFCYVQKTNKIFFLDKNMQLGQCDWQNLINIMQNSAQYFDGDLDELFKVSQFLVSPINNPDLFLKQEYFLTQQQNIFKQEYINDIVTNFNKQNKYHVLSGGPGTGKTLLLYDTAMYFVKNNYRVCIIHCGMLANGHAFTNEWLRSRY